MNLVCEDLLPKPRQAQDLDLGSNTKASSFTQELSNTLEPPICYLFRNFWIELTSLYSEKYYLPTDNKNTLWKALVHCGSGSKTVIALGSYPSRLEAALKAEQVISKWK